MIRFTILLVTIHGKRDHCQFRCVKPVENGGGGLHHSFFLPIAFILFIGAYLLSKNGIRGNAIFYIGGSLFMIVVAAGSIAYFVKGNRIKRWMKIYMPDEAKRAGLPY